VTQLSHYPTLCYLTDPRRHWNPGYAWPIGHVHALKDIANALNDLVVNAHSDAQWSKKVGQLTEFFHPRSTLVGFTTVSEGRTSMGRN
jgi:hypothetical protein